MICGACGTEYESWQAFCDQCGVMLEVNHKNNIATRANVSGFRMLKPKNKPEKIPEEVKISYVGIIGAFIGGSIGVFMIFIAAVALQ